MLNIKTKFDTFQILGKEVFSKRTNIPSWEGSDYAKILQSLYRLINLCC